jgi:rhodanese-related sulfurtransferase
MAEYGNHHYWRKTMAKKSVTKANKTAKRKNNARIPLWVWFVSGAVVLGILLLIISGVLTNQSESLPMEISVAEAAKLKDAGAFILDVREQSEWDSFHIPGANLIPLGELSARLNELPSDKPIVVVCRTGHRSAQGRDILLSAGFKKVTSMSGGVTEWQAEGYPIVTGK